ncbi:ABC transporter substrate-binding protein [Actinoplanes sp. NBRC 14428]|uniref:Amino acid ABC transporter substrate-binding protein (PAAT family) n=1 Tax=Pseudosporangium ferrugineum TaxID=439699 RepID=A0A2T0SJJ1_9ACTN|nr:glutamate ABC transporter substrate-binding protein [Pseudosporangium ferrugineum]PRY33568.1 amino acid ABC transporter substrate-binding protein (PAAT family) [Pseudosporangium ferrugineum]BCJ56482.1 ABC transporter substrate-binding protein [Actinoplanes sp. NBRC 14428]
MRIRAAAVAAVLTVLAAAGCSGDSTPLARPAGPSAEAPAPAGPATAPDTSCRPRASLRPPATLPEPGKMPAGSYMRTIQDRGRLVLGTGQDLLLFSSRNPFTGRIEGFDVDMGRQIADAIFGDPDKIQIKVIPYDKRISSAHDGSVDLVANTLTANCARWKDVDFSTIYYDAAKRVLVSSTSKARGMGDLGGRKVCAARGSTSYDGIVSAASKPVPVARDTFGDCLVAFQQNEVDAISTDDAILAGLAAQDPFVEVVGEPLSQEPYAMAVSKEHPEFTRFVNAVLARNRANGTWKRTYERWLPDLGAAPKPPAAEYRD